MGCLFVILILLTLFFKSTPPSPIYFLKVARESVQSFFIFGTEDNALWLLTRAEKRISESESLKNKNLNYLASIQLQSAKDFQTEADNLIISLKDKINRNYLIDKYNQNNDRIKALEKI